MATTRQSTAAKTWSMFGEVRKKPTPYEVVTGKFHYHFRREPAPFELDPDVPLNRWYLKHREGSPFQVDDWEGFRDPAKLTYKSYVELQKERETYLDGVIDAAEDAEAVTALPDGWPATLRDLFIPLRFPLHALQMTGLYVGQMSPSSYITNCANFQAADEMRRIQRFAYWTKVLANAHGDDLAETGTARTPWESADAWQPLREAVERMLIAYDWGESFVALDLAVKPALDALVNVALARLADANGDRLLSQLLADFERDSRRGREWSTALVKYAVGRRPEVADVLTGWLEVWKPRGLAGAAALAPLFESAPTPMAADDVQAIVNDAYASFEAGLGL